MSPAQDGLAAAVQALERAGCNPHKNGKGYAARCPVKEAHKHGDRSPSLTVDAGTDGRALFHCHTGCTFEDILTALDPTPPQRDAIMGGRKLEAAPTVKPGTLHYVYQDEHGAPLFRAVRQEGPDGKRFWQERANGAGGWTTGLADVRRVVYRLPQVLEAVRAGRTVYVAEGEKCVDALVSLGLDATCNPAGAGKWKPEHSETLRAARAVRVLADNDAPGEKHAQAVAQALHLAGVTDLRLMRFREQNKPGGTAGGDVADWLEAHASIPLEARRKALLELIEAAPAWTPEEAKPEPGPAAAGEPFRFLNLDELREHGIPPVPWLLPGWIAERDIAVLAGPAGIGKSTTAAHQALALAAGLPWCGIEPPAPVRVLYFDEEQGEPEVARLFIRLLEGFGLQAAPETLRVASGQGVNLATAEGIARLEREIAAHRAAFVFLDSVQQVFGGVEENNAVAVGQVFGNLFRLREAYGVGFELIHHRRKPPTDGGRVEALDLVRGSTAFTTQASTVWAAMSAGPSSLELVQGKRRGGTKTSLRIAYSAEGDDGPIRLAGEGPVAQAETHQAKAEQLIRDRLADRGEQGTGELEEACQAAGIPRATAQRALAQLKRLGVVIQPKRGRWRLSPGASGAPQDTAELPF